MARQSQRPERQTQRWGGRAPLTVGPVLSSLLVNVCTNIGFRKDFCLGQPEASKWSESGTIESRGFRLGSCVKTMFCTSYILIN